jgi:hypothetical protein
MPCSPLKSKRRFGGTYRLQLQGRRISQARNQCKSRWQVSTTYTCDTFCNICTKPTNFKKISNIFITIYTYRHIFRNCFVKTTVFHSSFPRGCEDLERTQWDNRGLSIGLILLRAEIRMKMKRGLFLWAF